MSGKAVPMMSSALSVRRAGALGTIGDRRGTLGHYRKRIAAVPGASDVGTVALRLA